MIKEFLLKRAADLGFIHKSKLRRRDASLTSRLNADWISGRRSRNDQIQTSLATQRDRARLIATRNPYGKKFIAQCKANVVGPSGMPLKVRSVDPNGILDARANGLIAEAWADWCKPENCTTAGRLSFTSMLQLCAGDEPKSGEILARFVLGFDNAHKFAIQLIEPDCLDENLMRRNPDGTTIRMGVERDKWNRPTAYYLRRENPNDSFSKITQHDRIPASEIIHKFIPVEVNDVRGMPWFEASTDSMHMLEGYDEASLVAARAGASKLGFYKPTANAAGDYTEIANENGELVSEVSPGQWEILPPGYDPIPYDPQYPHDQYPSFVKSQLRRIASGLLVSYESIANDRESVNYSSIRAGMLEERDVWKMLQSEMIQNFCEPIFAQWLLAQLNSGNINLPAWKFEKFNKPKFIGRGWAWVDPEKDINASIKAINAHLTTHSKVVAETGGDFAEICEGAEDDAKMATDYGFDLNAEATRAKADVIGLNVRSGIITPTLPDEEKTRTELGMPPLSKDAKAAWAKDGGVRRPNTLIPEPVAPKPVLKEKIDSPNNED